MSSHGVRSKRRAFMARMYRALTNMSPFDGTVSRIAIHLTCMIRAGSNTRTPAHWRGESLNQTTDHDILRRLDMAGPAGNLTECRAVRSAP